jgi:hypothetical protein
LIIAIAAFAHLQLAVAAIVSNFKFGLANGSRERI